VNCHVGAAFKKGHVGMLSKVKYFFTAFERATHPGVTKF
jgi:hypothetical protein